MLRHNVLTPCHVSVGSSLYFLEPNASQTGVHAILKRRLLGGNISEHCDFWSEVIDCSKDE